MSRIELLKVNVQSKERRRNVVMFCRGIGESPLPTSPRWSSPLIHARIKCSLWVNSSILHRGESPTTAHNLSWAIHKLRWMITKLPVTTKPSR